IDSTIDMRYYHQVTQSEYRNSAIAGSRRNLEDVSLAVACGMLPTIGHTLLNTLLDQQPAEFLEALDQSMHDPVLSWIGLVPVDHRHSQCTFDFFRGMDDLGRPIYDSFRHQTAGYAVPMYHSHLTPNFDTFGTPE